MRRAVEQKTKKTIPFNKMGVMFWLNVFIFKSFLSAVLIKLCIFWMS